MPEPTIDERRRCADHAMDAYVDAKRLFTEPDQDKLQDLLADLMHWCDDRGVDFSAALRVASSNYEDESGKDALFTTLPKAKQCTHPYSDVLKDRYDKPDFCTLCNTEL